MSSPKSIEIGDYRTGVRVQYIKSRREFRIDSWWDSGYVGQSFDPIPLSDFVISLGITPDDIDRVVGTNQCARSEYKIREPHKFSVGDIVECEMAGSGVVVGVGCLGNGDSRFTTVLFHKDPPVEYNMGNNPANVLSEQLKLVKPIFLNKDHLGCV